MGDNKPINPAPTSLLGKVSNHLKTSCKTWFRADAIDLITCEIDRRLAEQAVPVKFACKAAILAAQQDLVILWLEETAEWIAGINVEEKKRAEHLKRRLLEFPPEKTEIYRRLLNSRSYLPLIPTIKEQTQELAQRRIASADARLKSAKSLKEQEDILRKEGIAIRYIDPPTIVAQRFVGNVLSSVTRTKKQQQSNDRFEVTTTSVPICKLILSNEAKVKSRQSARKMEQFFGQTYDKILSAVKERQSAKKVEKFFGEAYDDKILPAKFKSLSQAGQTDSGKIKLIFDEEKSEIHSEPSRIARIGASLYKAVEKLGVSFLIEAAIDCLDDPKDKKNQVDTSEVNLAEEWKQFSAEFGSVPRPCAQRQ